MSETSEEMIKRLDEISNKYNKLDKSNIDEMAQIGFDAIEAIVDAPDEEFNALSILVLQEMRKVVNTKEFTDELTRNLIAQGTNIDEYLASYDGMIEEVDNRFKDKYDYKRRNFIHQMVTLEWEAMARRYKYQPGTIVNYEIVRDNVIIPSYAHDTDSGLDVYATEDYIIEPGATMLIPTGIKVAIPAGYELQVRPKSGRSLKTNLRIANTPGTIDAGYRDEVCVIVQNIAAPIQDIEIYKTEDGQIANINIKRGNIERIEKSKAFAQLVLTKIEHAMMTPVENISEIGEDRGGGFGSTKRD